MSGTITESVRFGIVNGSYDPGTINIAGRQVTQTNQGAAGDIQEIGTSEETLSAGGLSSRGRLFMRNLDATNYIEWGFSTGVYGSKLDPGDWAYVPTSAAADIYLKANTAACKLQYRWLEV